MQALLALILKNVDPELQVSIHVPVLSIRSDRRQETLSMPKHISVKNQNWTIIFGDVFCLSLNSVQPKKKIDSPDALPLSYKRLLSGVYITVRRGVICDLDCSLYPFTTHRQCFYTVESSKPSFDRLINLVIYLSNRPHFLWVYRRDNPLGMLGEHEKSL